MENVHILTAGLTAVILFLFGLENFSKEIENITGERFRKSLARATKVPLIGVLIGALVTAVIQSSSATSVIAISLVNAGVISFKNSVGIIIGSNIGTTITSQLVAFKLTAFAPLIIILGFFLSLVKSRYTVFGKAVFYFGFVFFSLNLISATLEPLQGNDKLVSLLTQPQNPLYAVFFGFLFTALVQSSSVTTGLAIIFTQQGLLSIENAVPLLMGANIGTATTAMIAMFSMDAAAKKTALSHFLFNVGGVVIFFPAFLLFGSRLQDLQMDPAIALANLHLFFNLATSLVFMLLYSPFTRFIDYLIGEGKMDFQRLELPVFHADDDFATIQSNLQRQNDAMFQFLQENYSLVTLSLETNYGGVYEAAGKRIEYMDFVEKEYVGYFSQVVSSVKDHDQSKSLIHLINQFDYLFQIHDSITDLYSTKKLMIRHWIELKSDILLLVRKLSSETLELFNSLRTAMDAGEENAVKGFGGEAQEHLNEAHRKILELLGDPERKDVGALTNFVTYSQRLKDKLVNYTYMRIKTTKAGQQEVVSQA